MDAKGRPSGLIPVSANAVMRRGADDMTDPRETARQIAERIKAFVCEHSSGGCHVLSIGKSCPCPLCAVDALTAALAQAQQDIHAYRGALGYAVPGECGECLTDGTRPRNGIAEALHQQLAAARPEPPAK